ncbi:hypothetical protein VC87395_001240 [Vibrio paracholerae 87395]|nr:hypothetical protein VC87395_001240 [Vibrio paracholerae 87395]
MISKKETHSATGNLVVVFSTGSVFSTDTAFSLNPFHDGE